MTKKKNLYICTECGYKSSQWIGKCNNCLSWNSYEIESELETKIKVQSIKSLSAFNGDTLKIKDIRFEKLLGTEIPKSSLLLFSGEPGVGKSTFVLYLMANIEAKKILYISAEESETQIYQRCRRIGLLENKLEFVFAESWSHVKDEVNKYDLVILDSIQAIQHDDFQGQVGSTAVVKEIASEILSKSKSKKITFLIISQVNKEGAIAGPKALEHMVDVSLHLQICRKTIEVSTSKNRFGRSGELINFIHEKNGIKIVNREGMWSNALGDNKQVGIALSTCNLHERIYLNKVEVLIRTSRNPKNIIYNYEISRLNVLVAILENSFDINFENKEIYLNNINDAKIRSLELDLSVVVSILSQWFKKTIKQNWIFIGELSLTGNIIKHEDENELKKLLTSNVLKKIIVNSTLNDPRVSRVENILQIGELLGL